jgi:hypothetical protein
MKSRLCHSTAMWLMALACLLFGFAPLLVMGITAAMEFAWLLATDSTVMPLRQVLHDWAQLYWIDGQYATHLFIVQVVCAILWCVYLSRMRWRVGQR